MIPPLPGTMRGAAAQLRQVWKEAAASSRPRRRGHPWQGIFFKIYCHTLFTTLMVSSILPVVLPIMIPPTVAEAELIAYSACDGLVPA